MNWYEKHLGDWAKKCGHLTLAEEGAYNRLIDWCYAHECCLPPGLRDVHRIARCTTPQERRTVDRVVREFFELMDDGWHQSRVDRVLAEYLRGAPAREERKASAKERQQRSRERRVALVRALGAAGLSFDATARSRDLWALAKEYGIEVPVTRSVTDGVTRDEPVTPRLNHPPLPTHHSANAHDVTRPAGAAGRACKAMRIAGVQDVNPHHPDLLRLLDAGASDDELRLAAAEASAKRKGFAYALAIVDGRRKDAAQKGPASPGNGARSAAEEVVKAWAPALASRAPEAVFPIEAPK